MTERIHSEVSVWLGETCWVTERIHSEVSVWLGGDMLGDREDSFRGVCMVGGRHVG